MGGGTNKLLLSSAPSHYQIRQCHSGTYTCVAENISASAQSKADVVVRKKVLSPVVLRKLKNLEVAEGARIVAEVEIGGTPLPIVKWFKDGTLITAGTRGLDVRKDGCRHLLIIEKAKVAFLIMKRQC